MMKTLLNGIWHLKYIDPKNGVHSEIPAQVPGNVYADLVRAGKMPDPYFGSNSNLFLPYESVDWTYSTNFESPEIKPGEKLQLTFDGVDTAFELFINGKSAGSAHNMFIEHCFDITPFVHAGSNELVVTIQSSINYARRFKKRPVSTQNLRSESIYMRRPCHTYGWDIAPRLVGAGIWRRVTLEVLKPTRLTEHYIFLYNLNRSDADICFHWAFDTDIPALNGFEIELDMKCGDSVFNKRFPVYFINGKLLFKIPDLRLWWPIGYGKQDFYDTAVRLYYKGELADEHKFRVGLRDILLDRTETNFSGEGRFCFLVNGKKIFIKGSNWVPADALHGEHPERVCKALELFKELGCNMVRCWGGNIYEDHDFFDYCDKNGLLVWQDFMFACEIPPQEQWFKEEIREEAEAVIKKLRQHPSLALWCGDNECDESFFYSTGRRSFASMNKITREILPEQMFLHDPMRSYLPSSPYLCDEIIKTNQRYASPEQHLWGPRDTWKNPFYGNNTAIFASEIGYHGMPSPESVKKFIPEDSWNDRTVENLNWLCHASQPYDETNGPCSYRIKLMHDQVEGFWGYIPENLEDFSVASQVVQAEAMKFFIESFRMHKWSKTGLIWWNVIDCWPQFSDAVVDYYYDKKLAFYYIKNVQKPVMLFFDEPASWSIRLHGVNDLDHPVRLSYEVSDFASGEELLSGSYMLGNDDAEKIATLRICQGKQRILRIDFEYEGQKCTNHYLQANAPCDKNLYLSWLKTAREIYI